MTDECDPLTGHRSVSQYGDYETCPHMYYRKRVLRDWQRPAAWLPQGNAFHESAEAFELSGRTLTLEETQDVYRDSYSSHTNELCETTPNFDWWFSSGRYGGQEDVERRYGIGLEQTARYVQYASSTEEKVWTTDDGVPGVELPIEVDLGGVTVRGKVDQVYVQPNGTVRVRDLKSGNLPGGTFQLATYAVAVGEQYGQHIAEGDYWMGKSGNSTTPYDLSDWTKERVTEAFQELDENIKGERFDAIPEQRKCSRCSVNLGCPFVGR